MIEEFMQGLRKSEAEASSEVKAARECSRIRDDPESRGDDSVHYVETGRE